MMIPLGSLATLAAILASYTALASPARLAPLVTVSGDKVANSYIVHLKSNTDKANAISWLGQQHANASSIKYSDWSSEILHGFSAQLSTEAMNALRAFPDVESISEDGYAKASSFVTQRNAPWGLSRISQNGRESSTGTLQLNFTYTFDSSAGQGVDIYVIDTGINVGHLDFGGRASLGRAFGPYTSANDDNGHGTHVAGTAGSATFGVAKRANLIAVKVLGADGRGPTSDIISGINFVLTTARQRGRPSVANLSLGSPPSTPLDQAAQALFNSGVHVVIAAGNDHVDSRNSSPARTGGTPGGAITVGASTIQDAAANFSNFGPTVDLYAPGQEVLSTWIGSNKAVQVDSGTSMAAPHVAGLIANAIGQNGNNQPAALKAYLKQLGLRGVLSGVPSGTPNILARNNAPQ